MHLYRTKGIIIAAFLIIIVLILGDYIISRKGLKITSFTIIDKKITASVRIVQLTDLHNSVFGNNNERLVQAVKKEKPDLIFITGDLLNKDDPTLNIAINIISELKEIAPVFCSLGNHEIAYEQKFGIDIKQRYEKAGAIILEYGWKDIDLRGNKLRIGGIYGYCIPKKYLKTGETNPKEAEYLNMLTDTDRYCLLLAHMPLCWLRYGSLNDYDVDVVFSGHVHGGQILLPFIGGLYAPDQGWFVGKEWGVFNSEDGGKHLVLSTGLGSNEKIPRFNNIPEIVSIVLEPVN